MTYELLQDSRGSTGLSARAQNVLAAQGRVTRAALELRNATHDYEIAASLYEQEKRNESIDRVRCGKDVRGTVPSWAGSDQIDPCSCVRPEGHEPPCRCAHDEPSDMVPKPSDSEHADV